MAEPSTKRVWIFRSLLLGVPLAIGVFWFALWFQFHSIPTEKDLRGYLERADKVEIFRWHDGRADRWVPLSDPSQWQGLSDKIHYKQQYWLFSDEPQTAVVFQAFENGNRTAVFEVRGDGSLHLRKAARWYRMPVEPGFEEVVVQILHDQGKDIPADGRPGAEKLGPDTGKEAE